MTDKETLTKLVAQYARRSAHVSWVSTNMQSVVVEGKDGSLHNDFLQKVVGCGGSVRAGTIESRYVVEL